MFRVQAKLSVFQKLEDWQTVVDAQFLVDVVDVDLDGVLGDEKLLRDHLVLPSPHQEGKDFPLPPAQIVFVHEGSEVEVCHPSRGLDFLPELNSGRAEDCDEEDDPDGETPCPPERAAHGDREHYRVLAPDAVRVHPPDLERVAARVEDGDLQAVLSVPENPLLLQPRQSAGKGVLPGRAEIEDGESNFETAVPVGQPDRVGLIDGETDGVGHDLFALRSGYREMSDGDDGRRAVCRRIVGLDSVQPVDAPEKKLTRAVAEDRPGVEFIALQAVPDIAYFFGWKAAEDPSYHYLIGPRAELKSGGLDIVTINSHHSGGPEMAWLVKVERLVI